MEPKYYQIANWEKFQHYKDRSPSWIKLYFGMLSSEDWVTASDETRVLMIALLLIGSKKNGKFLHNIEYIKRVAYLSDVNLEPLVSSGFIVPASEVEQTVQNACLDKIREDKNIFIEFWSNYPRKIGKQIANTAWNKVVRKYPPEDIIKAAMEYSRQCKQKRTEEQYILHPSTFLNKERWKDYCLE